MDLNKEVQCSIRRGPRTHKSIDASPLAIFVIAVYDDLFSSIRNRLPSNVALHSLRVIKIRMLSNVSQALTVIQNGALLVSFLLQKPKKNLGWTPRVQRLAPGVGFEPTPFLSQNLFLSWRIKFYIILVLKIFHYLKR